jgi:PAS domain S-box-containing protein
MKTEKHPPQRQAEMQPLLHELQAHQIEQYRFLVDHLPAGLLVHAADTRVVLSNPKASELLGLSQEQMQGQLAAGPSWQFLREDASPMPVEEYPAQRVFVTGQPVSNQLLGIRHPTTGKLIWMLAHAYPDVDAQGQVRQTVVMLTDISRRKQTEVALQASEARYRELYRSAQRQTQEMALLDRVRSVVAGELDQAVVIRKVVSAIAELFGYPLVSLYLRQGDTLMLQHQVGYEQVVQKLPISKGILGRVIRTGQAALSTDVRTDADFLEGASGTTSEICVPLFDRGQTVGVLNVETRGVVLTEADLRLLTALAEQIGIALGRAWLYTQVREDAATKAILLHEVNHRVKNNLSAIIGLFQLQQDYLPPTTQSAHRPLFDDLIGRIQSLAAVHDLLSAGTWAPLPIHDLADRIIQAVVALASRNADIAVDISPSPVQVTPKQASALALIINELATNSLKHALPQTTPLHLSLQITQEAKLVTLEYSDNGPGFPPEVLGGERHNVGLHLIQLLSRHDLRGKMSLSNGPGAVVHLSFGMPGYETVAPTGRLSIFQASP